MANEQTTGAPLTAPLGERLGEKGRLEEARAAQRALDQALERHLERKKAEEREAAVRHAGVGPDRPASPAEAARRVRRAGRAAVEERAGAGHPQWHLLLGGVALFGAVAGLRRLLRR